MKTIKITYVSKNGRHHTIWTDDAKQVTKKIQSLYKQGIEARATIDNEEVARVEKIDGTWNYYITLN